MSVIPQIVLNSIIAGAIYSLVALGFNLIYGTTKFFNLSHGVVGLVGGYVTFYLAKTLGVGVLSAAVAGIVASGLLGYCLDRFIFRDLRKKRASSMIFLVASLGLMTALQSIISILFTNQFQLFSLQATTYQFGGLIITQMQIATLVSVVLVSGGLILLLKKTSFGRAVRAISDDEEVAKIVGIDTDKILGQVFFIGSAIAGISGILSALDVGLEPTMGLSLLFKGVIASVIGGVGNVYGGILGALLLGFVENVAVWQLSGEWKDAVSFGLLILFLLFRPRGVLGK